ncbi:MAG: hypothetical protein ABSE51_11055 [Terracidiphilus sp.]|jgi:hypothetical protein
MSISRNYSKWKRWQLAVMICVSGSIVSRGAALRLPAESGTEGNLTIVQPASPEFEPLMSRYYPGLSSLKGYSAAKPYMALVQNSSGVPVRAFSIRFDCIERPGLPTESEYVKFLYDPLSEYPGVDRNGTVFAPNEVRLVAPGFLMDSPKAYLEFPSRFQWALPLMVQYPLKETEGETTPYSNVSVDAVVFSNHHMRGPNASRLFQKYTAVRDGRRAEWKLAQNALGNASEPEAIAKQLKAHESAGVAIRQTPTADATTYYKQQYALAQGLEAARINRLVQKQGVAKARRQMTALLRQPVEADIIE